jgi:hypothetical protein
MCSKNMDLYELHFKTNYIKLLRISLFTKNIMNLHDAASNGDLERIRELLHATDGKDVDTIHKQYTALHIAVIEKQHDAAQILIYHGASPTAPESFDGNTPIHYAAALGDLSLLEMMVSDGSVNAGNMDNLTPLHAASMSGHRNACEYLLKRGAVLDAADTDGDTPLHLACHEGHAHVALLLASRGADINAKNIAAKCPADLLKTWSSTHMEQLRKLCTCPVTHALFRDPVVAADGHTYERQALEEWLQSGNTRSIQTNSELPSISVVPNYSVRWISEWLALKSSSD